MDDSPLILWDGRLPPPLFADLEGFAAEDIKSALTDPDQRNFVAPLRGLSR